MSVVKAMVSAFLFSQNNKDQKKLIKIVSYLDFVTDLGLTSTHLRGSKEILILFMLDFLPSILDYFLMQTRPVLTSVGRGKPLLKVTVGGIISKPHGIFIIMSTLSHSHMKKVT